jgi:hypothetical protein
MQAGKVYRLGAVIFEGHKAARVIKGSNLSFQGLRTSVESDH